MGLFNKLDEQMGLKSINVDARTFAEMVQKNFIYNSSNKQLKALRKIIRSSFWRSGTFSLVKIDVKSRDDRYLLRISQAIWLHELILGRRTVWMSDNANKTVFRLPDNDFREFKKITMRMIDLEKQSAKM